MFVSHHIRFLFLDWKRREMNDDDDHDVLHVGLIRGIFLLKDDIIKNEHKKK